VPDLLRDQRQTSLGMAHTVGRELVGGRMSPLRTFLKQKYGL
jgi:hypothetical protein